MTITKSQEMQGTIQKLTATTTFLLLVLFSFSVNVLAQVENQQPPNNATQPQQETPVQNFRLDEFLDLRQEQRDQIREINRKMQPQIQLANRRFQLAQRALDQAIYEDDADEALIEQRLRELAAAHVEQARLRSKREFQFRKVLTPEQIQRFLIWRQRMVRQQQRLRQQFRRNQQNRQLQNEEPNQQPLKPRQNPNNFPLRRKIRRNQ